MTDETNDKVLESEDQPKLNFDPKEVEAQLIKQAQERADDPTETASTAYSMYVPHYKRLMPKLSTRSLRRILNYLILYPFEQDEFNGANDFEKQFMQMSSSLVEAKVIMIMDQYRLNAQKMYDAQQNELTEEEKDEVIKELKSKGITDEEILELEKQHKSNQNGI